MTFEQMPKEDIVLFKYPTYTLLGRILSKDVEKYKQTLDDSLILYRFCSNGITYVPNNDEKKKCKPGTIHNPR